MTALDDYVTVPITDNHVDNTVQVANSLWWGGRSPVSIAETYDTHFLGLPSGGRGAISTTSFPLY